MIAPEKSEHTRSKRGFSTMDPRMLRELARKGGRAAHKLGRAHEFSSEEARIAGRKGGEAVSRDRAHMAAIGRSGGRAGGRNRALQAARERLGERATISSPGSHEQSGEASRSTAAE
jgi:uncharacterized protein